MCRYVPVFRVDATTVRQLHHCIHRLVARGPAHVAAALTVLPFQRIVLTARSALARVRAPTLMTAAGVADALYVVRCAPAIDRGAGTRAATAALRPVAAVPTAALRRPP